MGSIATVFTKFDQAGQSYTDGAHRSHRYARTSFWDFLGTPAGGSVSSIRVLPGPGAPTLILFHDLPMNSFDGEFMQFTNAANSKFDLDLSGDLAEFNNEATSMLVVQTQLASEFRFNFSETVVPQWNKFVDKKLPSDVKRVGDPSIRWVAFPENVEHLNPDRIYVRIRQKLNVILENWSDYEATMTYWVRFRTDGGKVVSVVSKWACWVEGGIFAGEIIDELGPKVEAGTTDLKNELNSALGAIPGNVTSVYMLPGNQVKTIDEGFQNVHWSSSRGDATVVVQL